MAKMDETELEASLDLYRSQLSQVEMALQAAGEDADLGALQTDLKELIQLTEESLLTAKKNRLLQSLESAERGGERSQGRTEPSTSGAAGSSRLDDEYAAFQAAILEEDGGVLSSAANPGHSEQPPSPAALSPGVRDPPGVGDSPEPGMPASVEESFAELVGMRCRAPFSHDWGGYDFHNALVFSVEPQESQDAMPKVRVMFCHPTHRSMVPCRFFLEGKCRFSEADCRYSHGHLVEVESLREYKEPDFRQLGVDRRCLARGGEGVWFPTTAVEVGEATVLVMDGYGGTLALERHQVLPLEDAADGSSSSDSDNDKDDDDADDEARPGPSMERVSDSDSEVEIPVMLWKPPQTLDALGEWEQHTKGVGSRLMAKMGYVVGQGLGPKGEGRALPVPIQLLPQGKSLDKIMELKEMAGDSDLFDAMKKLKKKKKKMEKAEAAKSEPKHIKSGVFDFLNKRLAGKKGSLVELMGDPGRGGVEGQRQGQKRHIQETELDSRSDRHINVQLLKTEEEIKKTQKEIQRLRQSFSRNESKDKMAAARIQQKITSLERYVQQLQGSEVTLQRHRDKRVNHKKLTIF